MTGACHELSSRGGASTFRCPAASKAPERGLREALAAWILAGPSVFFLFILYCLPVIGVFVIAFTDWQFGAATLSFVGLDNFREVIADEDFRSSLRNTAIYLLIVVPGTVSLGLLIALLIEGGKSCRSFYRAIHFLPFMATMSAMAIAWEALLHPTIGLVNQTFCDRYAGRQLAARRAHRSAGARRNRHMAESRLRDGAVPRGPQEHP